jgi:LysM repeat protein
MEEETPKKRNVRPEETSRLPLITLITLLVIIAALFMIGYKYITDDALDSDEVTNVVPDTTSKLTSMERSVDPVLAEPDRIDTVELVQTMPDELPEEVAPPVKETPAPEKKPDPKPANVGGTEITHTVRAGDTFFGIANRYNLSVETLKSLNPHINDVTTDLKSGVTTISVRVQAVHTVGPGDVLRVVASKYGISKELLMQANGKTRDYAERGEKLVIPFGKKR